MKTRVLKSLERPAMIAGLPLTHLGKIAVYPLFSIALVKITHLPGIFLLFVIGFWLTLYVIVRKNSKANRSYYLSSLYSYYIRQPKRIVMDQGKPPSITDHLSEFS